MCKDFGSGCFAGDSAFRLSYRKGIKYLECLPLKDCAAITHAFCTRWGGISTGRLANLNFGQHLGDREENLKTNGNRLCSAFDIPDNLTTVRQVHGDRILLIDKTFNQIKQNTPLEYDGIITAIPELPIGIKTADCLPLLLVDTKKLVIGAIHAGWRGTAISIASKAIKIFFDTFASNPHDILAVLGPAIGPCCYEVDDELFSHFDQTEEVESCFSKIGNKGKWMFNLSAANISQLLQSGIPKKNIFLSDICTACTGKLFFSHRAEGGDTGRQLTFIMIGKTVGKETIEKTS